MGAGENMKSRKKAAAAAIAGNVIFGLSFMFSRVVLLTVDTFVMLALRFSIAFLAMNVLVCARVVKVDLKKDLRPLLALGLFQPVLYFTFESLGIKLTNSVISGSMIATVPVAGMLLGAVFLKERFTVRQLLFGLMSLAGAVLIAMSGEGGGASLAGILVLICAVITGSGFSLLSRRCADRYTAFERTYVMFGLGMAVFVTAALVTEGGNLAAQAGKALGDIRILGALLYLGIISSVAAFCMLNYSVNDLTVAQATSYTNLATVVSMVAGAIFLAEPVGPAHLAGCALILVGVYCSNREGIRVSLHQKQSVK